MVDFVAVERLSILKRISDTKKPLTGKLSHFFQHRLFNTTPTIAEKPIFNDIEHGSISKFKAKACLQKS